MSMLPIFLIGFVVGGIFEYLFVEYKKGTPSDTKFRIQEKELIKYKSDKETLEKLVDKLYAEIDELKKPK